MTKKDLQVSNFNDVIPSTKLKCINVHKLQDSMDCDRLYFWKWVLNIIAKKLQLPFWFGSIMHKASELAPVINSISELKDAMDKEAKQLAKGYIIDPYQRDEMDIQLEIGKVLLETYLELFKKELQNYKILGTEIMFRIYLKMSPITLTGTLDSYGKENSKLKLKEIKTASQINGDYFARLKFDKQINCYSEGLKNIERHYPSECIYCVIRKPQIRVKQNESLDQFLRRLSDDLYARPDFYFIREDVKLSPKSVQSVINDIEWAAFDLNSKYDYLSTEQILNPESWPRNDRACFVYGTCPYFILCRNMNKYKLFLQFFKMRDIRYSEEKLELSNKHKFSTKPTSSMKMKKGKN